MTRAHLKISVPKPCSESWAAMSPQGAGRHCSSCGTTVADFRQFTDKQLLEFLQQNRGKKCGRFSVQQLDRPVYLEPQPAAGFWPKVATGLALLIGISSQVNGQVNLGHPVPTNEVVPEKSQSTSKVGEVVTNSGETNAAEKGGLIISGRLLDANTLEALPFGNVLIKGTEYYCMTDMEGRFRIAVPASFKQREFILETPNVGYIKSELKVYRNAIPEALEIKLEASLEDITMGIVVMPPRKTLGYYFRKFWWGTKNFLGIREKGMVTGELEEGE